MKVYVCKFALTAGIIEADFEPTDGGYGFVRLFGSPYPVHLSRKDYGITLHEAIEKAEALRVKKIASHDKSIKKLKSLDIKVQ